MVGALERVTQNDRPPVSPTTGLVYCGLKLPWKRDVPSFPFGERAAILPSASAFSRTGRFFRSRINIVGRMVARRKASRLIV